MAHGDSREQRVEALYRGYAAGDVDRRAFMRQAAVLGVGAAAAPALDLLAAGPSAAQVQAAARTAAAAAPLDLAEWSYFWLGVKRAELARGTVVNGEQMYVEYWTPAEIRHPYPIVIVHGGGGQGLDWLGTPDGRPGWVTLLLQQGWRVYLVDRPGHGRSPTHPELQGQWPAQAATYTQLERQFTAPEKAPEPYGPEARLHTQWPGATGQRGDLTVDQVIAGQGGSFLADVAATHAVWARRGGELLDKIGPAVVMAHSAGGPSLWIYANARPQLVKGLVGIEPAGPPFGNLRYGVAASPLEFDPPIRDASELKTVEVPASGGRRAYQLQAEPARKLKNLRAIPIAVVTAEASYHWPYDMGTVAFLRQAGCSVDHIELEKLGIRGNGHFFIMEKNNEQCLKTVTDWLEAKVSGPARRTARPRPPRRDDSTALQLADHGFFWVGVEQKTMPYGVIPSGQMYVQYLIPREQRSRTPVVLVHGGSGQMLHYMGAGDGASGWAHYWLQAGYPVYLVDRPGHGRSVYHPDALGPINPTPTYEQIVPDFRRAKQGNRWAGTGEIGDPLIDQFMASQNAIPRDAQLAQALWRSRGAALLDRIGPAVVQTHSAGGPFGWLTADERPRLVRALVSFEGAGAPLLQGQPGQPQQVRPLPNLAGLRMMYLTAANSGRSQGPAIVDALRQSGATAEHLNLRDRGISGNGHFAMIETNRREVFEVIRGWVEGALRV